MNRGRKLLYNSISAIFYQVITIVCGFVLPSFLIPAFGSKVNGVISSITQFLTIVTLCEMGMGAVVQSALYKPLATKDIEGISKIFVSSKRFFSNIMKILAIYVVLLSVLYPLIIRTDFDFLFTFSLIFILAFNYIAQYYLFLTHRLVLSADQMSFIHLTTHSVLLIVNTILTIVLIKLGATIHVVKLASSIVFLCQPIAIKIYIDKHYDIDTKVVLTEEPLQQKWNGIAQHLVVVIRQTIPTLLLTFFATLVDISIYGVYFLVVNGVCQIIVSLSTGMQAMLGNMLANKEIDTLNKTYSLIEFALHTIVTIAFTLTGILIIPFIKVYTHTFTDANYIYPLFGILLTLAHSMYCLRMPYDMMIRAAGHYRETQTSSFIEAGLSVLVMLIAVICWGLIGVAIGTFVSIVYRMIYLVFYLKKNIIFRSEKYFLKHLFVDILVVALVVISTYWIKLSAISYKSWIVMALMVAVIAIIVSSLVNMIFYRKNFIGMLKFIKKKLKRLKWKKSK